MQNNKDANISKVKLSKSDKGTKQNFRFMKSLEWLKKVIPGGKI